MLTLKFQGLTDMRRAYNVPKNFNILYLDSFLAIPRIYHDISAPFECQAAQSNLERFHLYTACSARFATGICFLIICRCPCPEKLPVVSAPGTAKVRSYRLHAQYALSNMLWQLVLHLSFLPNLDNAVF